MGALGPENGPWHLNFLRPHIVPSMSIFSLDGPFFSPGHSGFPSLPALVLTQLGKEVLVLYVSSLQKGHLLASYHFLSILSTQLPPHTLASLTPSCLLDPG